MTRERWPYLCSRCHAELAMTFKAWCVSCFLLDSRTSRRAGDGAPSPSLPAARRVEDPARRAAV